ncbi:DNA helicase IV [Citrobacter freundii]|nr:DNA helicase IV [Citrobacter freundii]
MRMHGGAQAEMIANAPEEIRELFSKRIKLMSPLLKAWKSALKDENAVDFSGLIHQAIVILEKRPVYQSVETHSGRRISGYFSSACRPVSRTAQAKLTDYAVRRRG